VVERLQKFLARAGVASRREAEKLIVSGRIAINNQTVTTLGTKVDADKDLVTWDGKLVSPPSQLSYFILYKPPGVVTTLDDPKHRPTVADLIRALEVRVFPVGRLDYDAEGALLLTNDGDLAQRLMHPKFSVARLYLAKVRGVPSEQSLARLRAGVRLEDGIAAAETAEVYQRAEKNCWLKLIVREGRAHLIKRLCAAVGHPVQRLFRPSHGGIGAEGLQPGELRPLSREEVKTLHQVAAGASPPIRVWLPPRRHRKGFASDKGEQ
jgi:23S rRNA pseudouridine2605 synthase